MPPPAVAPRPPRWFIADAILYGRVNLDEYPLRYIFLSVPPRAAAFTRSKAGRAALIDRLFAAVELLETRGWEVVNFELADFVYMRRVAR
jgi:hypothetical protein